MAENVLIRKCMKEEGFDYPFTVAGIGDLGEMSESLDPFADPAGWDADLYGYRSAAEIANSAVEGHHHDGEGTSDHDHDSVQDHSHQLDGGLDPINESYVSSLSEADREQYRVALFGSEDREVQLDDSLDDFAVDMTRSTGCLGEAQDQAAGGSELVDRQSNLSLHLSRIAMDIETRSEANKGYGDALEAWRRCMSEEGYDGPGGRPFATPEAASSYARSELWPDVVQDVAEVSSDERTMARADKACRIESDVIAWHHQAFIEAENEVLADPETEALLLAWRESQEDAFRSAEVILQGEGLLSK